MTYEEYKAHASYLLVNATPYVCDDFDEAHPEHAARWTFDANALSPYPISELN